MIRVSYTEAELSRSGANFFQKNGVRCAVADVSGGYVGFVVAEDGVFQAASGWSKGWVESEVARQAEEIVPALVIPTPAPRPW